MTVIASVLERVAWYPLLKNLKLAFDSQAVTFQTFDLTQAVNLRSLQISLWCALLKTKTKNNKFSQISSFTKQWTVATDNYGLKMNWSRPSTSFNQHTIGNSGNMDNRQSVSNPSKMFPSESTQIKHVKSKQMSFSFLQKNFSTN